MENHIIIDAGYVIFDALWILALALNNTMTMVNAGDISETGCESVPGSLVNLHEFNYKNRRMGCVIRWNLNNTRFSGVSVCFCCITKSVYNVIRQCVEYIIWSVWDVFGKSCARNTKIDH